MWGWFLCYNKLMIYGGLLLLMLGLIYITKRSISQALVVLMATSVLAGLVTADLAKLVVSMSSSLPRASVTAVVRLAILLLPMLVVLMRAPKISRDLLFKLVDSALITAVIIILAGSTVASVIKLDSWSVQAQTVIMQTSKWLLIGAGLYGFYGLLKKSEDA